MCVDHVANGQFAFFLGCIAHAKTLGIHHVCAFIDHRESSFLGFRGIKPAVDEADRKLYLGIGFFCAHHEGMHQAIDFGDREAAHHANLVGLGHAAGDHAGEIGGLLNVVVKHAEIRRLWLAGAAHEEHGLGEIFGHFARSSFHRK